MNNSDAEPPNMHKKLQRQLTLNPVCDHRLCQWNQYQQALQQNTITSSRVQHRPVTRHSSTELPYRVGANLDHTEGGHRFHQHVTRIASAPDSYQVYQGTSNNSTIRSSLTSVPNQQTDVPDPNLDILYSMQYRGLPPDTIEDLVNIRRPIYCDLIKIFPEEHVRFVMMRYPWILDPIEIYRLIKKVCRKE